LVPTRGQFGLILWNRLAWVPIVPEAERRTIAEEAYLMLADFPVLQVDAVVRRTLGSCAVVAVVAFGLAIAFSQVLAGAGVLIGLGGAVANHRLFQISTARYSTAEGHLQRRPYAGSVLARLGALTAIAVALLYLVRPMGFGMIGGLVAFQVLLMANALGALWRYQRAQLAGASPGGGLSGLAPAPGDARPQADEGRADG
jgi:hypothetical protein